MGVGVSLDDTLAGSRAGAEEATLAATPAATARSPAAAELPRGTPVGRHIVLSRLGAGAMGVVYSAYDPELDRKVALKLLRAQEQGDSETTSGRTRLLREAQALARLSHPNVVAIYDVGTLRDQVWLAMEHVEGCTLRSWHKATPRGWRELMAVMLAVGRGLVAAHAAGLVHRDLKPDNIMIGEDGRARVMDFGLARTTAPARDPGPNIESGLPTSATLSLSVTQTGTLMGTPAYMAPEQIRGLEADARSDQFAFCVTLWEALYNERPFGGDSMIALATRLLAGELRPPPRGVRVPAWLRRVVTRGLQVEPARRFPSMAALLAALEQGQSRARTRRVLVGLTSVALLAAGLGLWRHHQRGEQVAACVAAGQEIEAVWNDQARESLRRSLLATEVAYAPATYEKVLPWLDRRAAEWSEHRSRACQEATIAGTLSPDLYARSTACLDERRDELDALLTVLGEANKAAVQRAVAAVAGLAQLSNCEDHRALERRPPPSSDPDRHARVTGLRRALMRALGLGMAGRASEGQDRALALLAEAEALGDAALIVELRVAAGGLMMRTGQLGPAEQALALAYLEGGAIGADEAAAAAAIYLIELVGLHGARYVEGLQWARSAEMLVRRLGQMDTVRGSGLLNNLANLHAVRGAYSEALVTGERALAIRMRELGPEHPSVAASLTNLAELHRESGDLERAVTIGEQALVIGEQALGPDHPNVATTLNNLGGACILRGEPERAEALLTRALKIREQALGPEHAEVSTTLNNLGDVYRQRGELDRAHATLQRALAITERALGPDHPHNSFNLMSLAAIAVDRGELGEALELGERALALREKTLGAEHPDVARARTELARIHITRGEADAARAHLERAVAIWEHGAGVEAELADPLTVLGELLLARARPGEALPLLERALGLLGTRTRPATLARVRFAVARALTESGGDPVRARELATQAVVDSRAAGDTAPDTLPAVETWLRSH